ncbi:4Fe-4S dicluster domain-containing protein [Chloroflexota bacterium]
MKLARRDFLKMTAGTTGLLLLRPPGLKALAGKLANQSEVGLLIDVSKCVGCWWCYMACKEYNGLPETGMPSPEQPPGLAPSTWITLFTKKDADRWRFRRQACMHCTDAACVKVCPTGAVKHNDLGFVQYDRDLCSGCGYCAENCPFDVPKLQRNRYTGVGQMNKCTFCIDRVANGQPTSCAEACPTGATKYGNRIELQEEGKQRVIELRKTKPEANLYGLDKVEGLHVLYVLDDSPQAYGLPTNPEVPLTVMLHNILQQVGIWAVAAAVTGFGFNYFVARMRISKGGK